MRSLMLLLICGASLSATAGWKDVRLEPDEWFRSNEAGAVAANVLSWQTDLGDWPKNVDTFGTAFDGSQQKPAGTFDNRATVDEIRFLARMTAAADCDECRDAALKAIDHVIAAQYLSGGFPQSFPPPDDYRRYATFNDGTIVNLLTLLREIERDETYAFAGEGRRRVAGRMVQAGIRFILLTQHQGRHGLTIWAAQYDDRTFDPRTARAFEPASLTSAESAGVLLFLMSLENPNAEVVTAVEAGVTWFANARLRGIRVVRTDDDVTVVADRNAPPVWARFYDLDTMRPLFAGRDGVVKHALTEIEQERRTGYAWYGDWGTKVLSEYPKWRQRLEQEARERGSGGQGEGGTARGAMISRSRVGLGPPANSNSPRLPITPSPVHPVPRKAMFTMQRVKPLIGLAIVLLVGWFLVTAAMRYRQTQLFLRDAPEQGISFEQEPLQPDWFWRPIAGKWSHPLSPITKVAVWSNRQRPRTGDDWPERIAAISTMTELDLRRGVFREDEVLRLIAAEPDSLAVLWLNRSDLGDATLQALADLDNLERVHISETLVTKRGIDRLRIARPELKIIADPMTRYGLGDLRRRTRVDLDASRRHVVGLTLPHDATAEEAASLAKLPGPLWVGVHPHAVDVLPVLARLPNLRRLELSHHAHSSLTPEHLHQFADTTSLQELTLNHAPITDEFLPAIAAIRSLRGVDLAGTRVTEEGLNTLRDLRPDLDVRSKIATTRMWAGSTEARVFIEPEPRWQGPNPVEISQQER